MYLPFNFFVQFLAAAAITPGSDTLSEQELIARYPAIAAAATVLLVAGLICDLYLVIRFARPALSNNPSTGYRPALKVDSKPWDLRDLFTATSAVIFVLLAGELVVTLTFRFMHWTQDSALPCLLVVDMILRVVVLFGFVFYFRQRGIDWRRAFGFRGSPRAGAIGWGATLFVAVLPPLWATFALSSQFCRWVGIREEPQDVSTLLATSGSVAVVALITVLAIAIAPVFEELLFRGFAYPVLKQRWGACKALVVVSVAFAAIHLHLPSLAPLFALAVGLGLAYELTGSLLAPITMHVLFNAANVLMILYVRAHP
jgi:membrane protease YdiL (CAAX protease family)